MQTEIIVAIVGGVLTIVNTIVGIAITNLFKSHVLIQSTLAQNQSDIRVNAVHLDHLMKTLQDHTESDRAEFEGVREQQQEHYRDNQKILHEIRLSINHLPKRKTDPASA